MTCDRTAQDVWRAMDGSLSDDESVAFAAHLGSCADCRDAFAAALRVERALLSAQPARGLTQRGQVRRAHITAPATRQRRSTALMRWIPLAAAALLAIAVGGWLLVPQSTPTPPPSLAHQDRTETPAVPAKLATQWPAQTRAISEHKIEASSDFAKHSNAMNSSPGAPPTTKPAPEARLNSPPAPAPMRNVPQSHTPFDSILIIDLHCESTPQEKPQAEHKARQSAEAAPTRVQVWASGLYNITEADGSIRSGMVAGDRIERLKKLCAVTGHTPPFTFAVSGTAAVVSAVLDELTRNSSP